MKKSVCLFLSMMLCVLTGCGAGASESGTKEARLLCLNIGKADCMLLLYGEHAYLIDSGYEQTYPALALALRQFKIERLNGVFLTHCHEDHMGGLMPLAKSGLPVDAWYAAEIYYDQKPANHPAVLAAAARGQDVTWLNAGAVIPVGKDGSLTVLGPISVNKDNENNNSLVMRFDSPAGSILLAGDMKDEEEYELLDAGALAPCDLLKVGHHGDGRTSTKELLQAVKPKAAVILTSTQEEPDTPASSTLKRLRNIGCSVYVSQNAQDALLFTLKNGQIEARDIRWEGVPQKAEQIELIIRLPQDTLTIVNRGAEPLSLLNYTVYSSKGNDLLTLPDMTLSPGQSCVIGSKATKEAADLTWGKKRIWHESKRDNAVLYDAYGRPVACTSNGIAE